MQDSVCLFVCFLWQAISKIISSSSPFSVLVSNSKVKTAIAEQSHKAEGKSAHSSTDTHTVHTHTYSKFFFPLFFLFCVQPALSFQSLSPPVFFSVSHILCEVL